MGTSREVHMRDYLSSPFSKKGACDECYACDGQVCVRPALFDAWLRALDLVLSTFGATRGGVKQHTPSRAPHAFCVLLSVRASFKYGTRIPFVTLPSSWNRIRRPLRLVPLLARGGSASVPKRGESVEACHALREASLSVDHTSTETVLTRYFASVSKILYRMRINGDVLDHDVLASYDGQFPSAVTASPGLLDTGAVYASCCALAEATRGHDTVADLIHEAATVCGPTAVMELPRLIPGTELRPASLWTTAQGNTHRFRRLGMLRGSRIGQRAPTLLDDLFVWTLACGRCDVEWDTVF